MESDFVNKSGKPSSEEYLSASLEEVIDRANKSQAESEIPFITALFAAKAFENQKKTSNKMFYVAIISTFIALLSIAFTYFESERKTEIENKIEITQKEVNNLQSDLDQTKKELKNIEQYIQMLENKTAQSIKSFEQLHGSEIKDTTIK